MIMFRERRTISRKTPGDGRLEITKEAAQRVMRIGDTFDVDLSGERVVASLGTFPCTCRGADNPHLHYFLESQRFKALSPGSVIDLEVEPRTARIAIRPADPASN